MVDGIAPQRTAANGVRQYHLKRLPEGKRGGDIYELPRGDGMPQRITVVSRPWWQGGGNRSAAVDGKGQPMETRQWDRQVTVVDAATHTVTRLDLNSLDLVVSAETISQTRPIPSGVHLTAACPVEERLLANGEIRVRSDYKLSQDTIHYSMVRECPPNMSIVVARHEEYEETVLRSDGTIRTGLVSKDKHQDPVVRAEVPSRVDQGGDLFIARGGKEEAVHLFVSPHAARGIQPA